MKAPRRLVVLDSFRGICAILVALHHFHASGYIVSSALIQNAFLFVDFFFVLSGFVISMRYFDEVASSRKIREFLVRRFWRLYPLHFVVLMVFLAIELLVMPHFAGFRVPFADPMGWRALGLNLLMLNSVGLTDGLTWNDPSWSIGAEALTYCVFAMAVRTMGRRSLLFFGLALIGSLVIIATYSTVNIGATDELGFVRCVAGFSMGVLVWRLGCSERSRTFAARVTRTTATWVEVLLMIAVLAFVVEVGYRAADLCSPLIFGTVVYWFSLELGGISSVLSAPWLVSLGVISYSVYMIHFLIGSRLFSGPMQALNHVGGYTFLHPDGSGRFGATPLQGDALTIVYVAVVIVAGKCAYRWIEMPGQRLFRRRRSIAQPRSVLVPEAIGAPESIGQLATFTSPESGSTESVEHI